MSMGFTSSSATLVKTLPTSMVAMFFLYFADTKSGTSFTKMTLQSSSLPTLLLYCTDLGTDLALRELLKRLLSPILGYFP